MSVTVNAAVAVPAAPAAKVTSMVQVAPAAKLEPQLLVWAKFPLLVPVIETPLIFTVEGLVFFKVNV